MEFTESLHEKELRDAVAAVVRTFGDDYYPRKAAAGEPTDEVWRALGDGGFIGVNIPEEFGGGGLPAIADAGVKRHLQRGDIPLW